MLCVVMQTRPTTPAVSCFPMWMACHTRAGCVLWSRTYWRCVKLCKNGVVMLSIGDHEAPQIAALTERGIWGEKGFGPVIVQVNKGGTRLPADRHDARAFARLGNWEAARFKRRLPKVGQVFSVPRHGWQVGRAGTA